MTRINLSTPNGVETLMTATQAGSDRSPMSHSKLQRLKGQCSFRAGKYRLMPACAPVIHLATHSGNGVHELLEKYVKEYIEARKKNQVKPSLRSIDLHAIFGTEKQQCIDKWFQNMDSSRYEQARPQITKSIDTLFAKIDYRKVRSCAKVWLLKVPKLMGYFEDIAPDDIHAEAKFSAVLANETAQQHWTGTVDLYWIDRENKQIYIIDYKSTSEITSFDTDEQREECFALLCEKYRSQLEIYACLILKQLEKKQEALDEDWRFKGSMLRQNAADEFFGLVDLSPSEVRDVEGNLVGETHQLLQTPLEQNRGLQCKNCNIRAACQAYSDEHYAQQRETDIVWDLDARVSVEGFDDDDAILTVHSSNYSDVVALNPIKLRLDLEAPIGLRLYEILRKARATHAQVQLLQLIGTFELDAESLEVIKVSLSAQEYFSLSSTKFYLPKQSEAFILA